MAALGSNLPQDNATSSSMNYIRSATCPVSPPVGRTSGRSPAVGRPNPVSYNSFPGDVLLGILTSSPSLRFNPPNSLREPRPSTASHSKPSRLTRTRGEVSVPCTSARHSAAPTVRQPLSIKTRQARVLILISPADQPRGQTWIWFPGRSQAVVR